MMKLRRSTSFVSSGRKTAEPEGGVGDGDDAASGFGFGESNGLRGGSRGAAGSSGLGNGKTSQNKSGRCRSRSRNGDAVGRGVCADVDDVDAVSVDEGRLELQQQQRRSEAEVETANGSECQPQTETTKRISPLTVIEAKEATDEYSFSPPSSLSSPSVPLPVNVADSDRGQDDNSPVHTNHQKQQERHPHPPRKPLRRLGSVVYSLTRSRSFQVKLGGSGVDGNGNGNGNAIGRVGSAKKMSLASAMPSASASATANSSSSNTFKRRTGGGGGVLNIPGFGKKQLTPSASTGHSLRADGESSHRGPTLKTSASATNAAKLPNPARLEQDNISVGTAKSVRGGISGGLLGSSGYEGWRWFRTKEKNKVLVKVYIIYEKVQQLQQMIGDLRDATLACKDTVKEGRENDNCRDAVSGFVQKTLEVDNEVAIITKLILLLCKMRTLEKHYGTLTSIHDLMKPTFDISVRFFGIDWPHISRVASNLVHLVKAIVDALKDSPDPNQMEIDVILPSNILRDLATIGADVTSHAEAVLRGRLSKMHQETILAEQLRFQALNSGQVELVENLKPKRSLWGAFKEMKLAFKKSKSDRHMESHDALWRAWYQGVQSIPVNMVVSHSDEDNLDGDREDDANGHADADAEDDAPKAGVVVVHRSSSSTQPMSRSSTTTTNHSGMSSTPSPPPLTMTMRQSASTPVMATPPPPRLPTSQSSTGEEVKMKPITLDRVSEPVLQRLMEAIQQEKVKRKKLQQEQQQEQLEPHIEQQQQQQLSPQQQRRSQGCRQQLLSAVTPTKMPPPIKKEQNKNQELSGPAHYCFSPDAIQVHAPPDDPEDPEDVPGQEDDAQEYLEMVHVAMTPTQEDSTEL